MMTEMQLARIHLQNSHFTPSTHFLCGTSSTLSATSLPPPPLFDLVSSDMKLILPFLPENKGWKICHEIRRYSTKGNYNLEKMFMYIEHFKDVLLVWQSSAPSPPHLGNLCSVTLLS